MPRRPRSRGRGRDASRPAPDDPGFDGPRRLRFDVGLTHPVLGITRRRGWLIEGPAGWGEWSPLPSWSLAEAIRAFRGAVEVSHHPLPPPLQATVEINAMIPRVPPGEAARLALASGCATIKVKVGDAEGEDRVRAVREALGRSPRIRLDANAAWDVATATSVLTRLAPLDIELVEDPVATLAGLAALRRAIAIPVAAEMCIRSLNDVRAHAATLRTSADALVIKPQRIGGVRTALLAAGAAGIPVIVSSALETSVGLGAVLATAAALPTGPFAHGIGTASLLETDVTSSPLLPVAGRLAARRVIPDLLLGAAVTAALPHRGEQR